MTVSEALGHDQSPLLRLGDWR